MWLSWIGASPVLSTRKAPWQLLPSVCHLSSKTSKAQSINWLACPSYWTPTAVGIMRCPFFFSLHGCVFNLCRLFGNILSCGFLIVLAAEAGNGKHCTGKRAGLASCPAACGCLCHYRDGVRDGVGVLGCWWSRLAPAHMKAKPKRVAESMSNRPSVSLVSTVASSRFFAWAPQLAFANFSQVRLTSSTIQHMTSWCRGGGLLLPGHLQGPQTSASGISIKMFNNM